MTLVATLGICGIVSSSFISTSVVYGVGPYISNRCLFGAGAVSCQWFYEHVNSNFVNV